MSSTKDPPDTAKGWAKSLARSKAQIDSGQTVPTEPVLERLRASAARMEARQAKQAARKAWIPLSPESEAQLDALLDQYEQLDRPEATRNLILALDQAADRIEREPASGLSSPRPYPALANLGFKWIKAGAFWFAYASSAQGQVIAGVFYASADIPNRIPR